MPTPTSVPIVKVDGSELSPSVVGAITDVRVYAALHETSTAVLRLLDPNMELLDGGRFEAGADLEMSFLNGSSTTSVFKGEIVAIGMEQRPQRRHELIVEAMDKSHRLSAVAKPKTYLRQKWSDIVRTIAGAHGLSATVTATDIQQEYVLQTVNDRAFLTHIAQAIGFEWFVDAGKLVFRPRPGPESPAVTLSWKRTLLRFEARASAVDAVKTVKVLGWNRTQQAEFTGTADASAGQAVAIGSSAPLATDTYKKGASLFGKEVELSPGGLLDAAEATVAAKVVARAAQAASLRMTGEAFGDAAIRPGTWVKIEDCGTKLSGAYYITEVEHIFGAEQSYRTRFKMTGQQPSGIVANGFAADGHAAWGRAGGLVVGRVTNINDSDGTRRRVKVKFPTMPQLESAWARVVIPGGGPKRGIDVRPEVDDEVLVGFEHGDYRLPYVFGGMTNKAGDEFAPAVNSDGSLGMRSITSRSGNRIELFDGDSKSASSGRHVTIVLADKKTKLYIGDDTVELTSNSHPIKLTAGKSVIEMTDSGIKISAEKVEVSGKNGVTLDGQTVEAKGKTGVTVDGGTKLDAKGKLVNIEGDSTQVKGKMLKLN